MKKRKQRKILIRTIVALSMVLCLLIAMTLYLEYRNNDPQHPQEDTVDTRQESEPTDIAAVGESVVSDTSEAFEEDPEKTDSPNEGPEATQTADDNDFENSQTQPSQSVSQSKPAETKPAQTESPKPVETKPAQTEPPQPTQGVEQPTTMPTEPEETPTEENTQPVYDSSNDMGEF